jgi:hypothetical protein
MRDSLKLFALSVVTAAIGVAALILARSTLQQGYAVVGRGTARVIALNESPLAFYASVAALVLIGLAAVVGAAILVFTRGQARRRAVAFVDARVFGVRPSIRWLAIGLTVLLVAFLFVASWRA